MHTGMHTHVRTHMCTHTHTHTHTYTHTWPICPTVHVVFQPECTNVCFWYIPPSLRGQAESAEWWDALSKVIVVQRSSTRPTPHLVRVEMFLLLGLPSSQNFLPSLPTPPPLLPPPKSFHGSVEVFLPPPLPPLYQCRNVCVPLLTVSVEMFVFPS